VDRTVKILFKQALNLPKSLPDDIAYDFLQIPRIQTGDKKIKVMDLKRAHLRLLKLKLPKLMDKQGHSIYCKDHQKPLGVHHNCILEQESFKALHDHFAFGQMEES